MGIWAILHQNGHHISYFSKKLSPRTQKTLTYFREMLVIAKAISKFKDYFLGHKFTTRIDQTSLRRLLDQNLQTPEQQEWLHKFLGYDCMIEYKLEKDNLVAYALSIMMSLSWFKLENWFLPKLKWQCNGITSYKHWYNNVSLNLYSKPSGLLQPLPIPSQVWEHIAMDFIIDWKGIIMLELWLNYLWWTFLL